MLKNEKKRFSKLVLILIFILLGIIVFASINVFAHEGEEGEHDEREIILPQQGIDWASPVPYVVLSALWLIAFTILLLIIRVENIGNYKKLFFWLMIIPIVLSSLYLAGNTIYENIVSETGGPVHWHADYQVLVCGERLDLIDPEGLSNRIGTTILHEHGDDRIHLEGTLREVKDASLGRYFQAIGGELESAPGHLIYPTEDKGIINYQNGDLCPDGSLGTLKVYVNGKRIDDFENYVIYPDSRVPPGDCVIIAFDGSERVTTDILCESWEAQGWSYDDFKRRKVTIGEKIWQ
ncbi:MAG: hypothetical protein IIA87_01110 [Nanoarchaeota archaeon]|nr:hypothetical protein [Nanoarchaeota archaeon]